LENRKTQIRAGDFKTGKEISFKHALTKAGWVEVERSDADKIELSNTGGPALVKIEVDASNDPTLSDAAMALGV
jgi:hypothetical protein